MAEPIEIPLGGLTHVSPRNHILNGVKLRRNDSQPRGVTKWLYDHLPNYF